MIMIINIYNKQGTWLCQQIFEMVLNLLTTLYHLIRGNHDKFSVIADLTEEIPENKLQKNFKKLNLLNNRY